MRVGSVLYNRNTGELVSVIPPDTLGQPRTDMPSRWLSIDPLAHKFAAWSPYNFVMNNPVVMIDPDGRDAIITITPGANGQPPTVTVLIVFHATNVDDIAQQRFMHSYNTGKHWGQEKLTYTSATGQVYDVKYDIQVLHDNDPKTNKPYTATNAPLGENTITFLPENTEKTSNYAYGHLDYRTSQEGITNFTTASHEEIHTMGTLHYGDLLEKDGKIVGRSMAAGGNEKDRIVLPIDRKNTVGPAVECFEKQESKAKLEMTLKTTRNVRADPTTTNTTNINMKKSDNIIRDKKTKEILKTYTPAGK